MRNVFFRFVLALAFALPAAIQSQNVFPPTGSVGIGTNTPFAPLHIAASSGGRSGVTLVQLEFKNLSHWLISLSAESSLYLSSAEGVGNLLRLTKKGEMTLDSLRGSGTRMLVANSDGVIQTKALPTAGGGSGDNLGNHTATTNLNMNSRDIVNVSRIRFDGQPAVVQTSASPWAYYNLPEGYKADYRLLIGLGNIDPSYKLKVEGDAYATGV